MAYVPTMPGVPAPMSYGQGYGNWQQYGGVNKDNPFGGAQRIPERKLAVAPPSDKSQVPATTPVAPEPIVPNYSLTPAYGVKQANTFGSNPANQYGIHSNLYDAVIGDDQ